MKIKNQQSYLGFTLIELLVVIAIIALLASVVLVALNSTRQKARNAKRLADMNQLAKAMEFYFNDKNSYPTTSGATLPGVLADSSTGCSGNGCVSYLVPTYLSRLPVAPNPADDPAGSTACSGAYGGGVGNDYQYAVTNTTVSSNYTMTFCLGSATGGFNTGGIHTLTAGGFQ